MKELMKNAKRTFAAILTLCLVMQTVIPAYAETKDITAQTEAVEVVPEAEAPEGVFEAKEVLEVIPEAEVVLPEAVYEEAAMLGIDRATPSSARRVGEILIREITVDGIKITLTADPGVFPEEAELWAERVEDEAAEEAIEEAVEKERDSRVNVASSFKFDIKMLIDGEEIQPDTSKGSVKVTFTLEEKLNDCLTANAYHLKEEADGELTAENLEAEVKTVEAAAMESADEDALPVEEIISDEIMESDTTLNTEVTEIEVEITGFSYYVVEFTYNELQYVLPERSSIKLSEILKALAIEGIVSGANVSDTDKVTVIKDPTGNDWTVTVSSEFAPKAKLTVKIEEKNYEIILIGDTVSDIENVSYIDEDGLLKTRSCIVIQKKVGQCLKSGWYVVGGDFSFIYGLVIEGDVHLILKDGCNFSSTKAEIKIGKNANLTLYGQEQGTGTWTNDWYYQPTFSADNGSFTINGGNFETKRIDFKNITVNRGSLSAGYINGSSTTTINDGTVNAAIGGGTVTINGGKVTATAGGEFVPGIHGNTKVEINGGTVTATGGYAAAGIGGGKGESGGTILISGGTVTAKGGDLGAGIGGGNMESGGTVTIRGGTVTATGGKQGAGIGSGTQGTKSISGGEVTISGGTVTATGGDDGGAGIGGGTWANGGTVAISGGTVEAHGKTNGAGIGGGAAADGGNVNITGGYVTAFSDYGAGIGGARNYYHGTLIVANDLKIYSGKSGDYAPSTTATDYDKTRDSFIHMSKETEEYKVVHQLQKADGTDYEEKEREVIYGVPGSMTKAKRKAYAGFTCEGVTQKEIAAGGSTEVPIKYRRNLYDITFDNNGIGSATEKITALYGATVTIDPEAPSAAGYKFSGWFEDTLCTKSFDTPKTIEMPLEGKTLYAKWTPVEYTITWKDGNKVLKTDKVAYGRTPEFGPDPTKEGYEFVSWWPEIKKVTGDTTYNAIFFKPTEKHTIRWMLDDFTYIDSTEVTEGEMPVHENPVREGYIFVGWQPALAPVTGDAKYTAYFVKRGEERVAVTFNTDGGTFIDTQVIGKDSIPERPEDPQKTGYTFEGWYREAGFVTPYKFNEPVNTDMILYAKWTKAPVKKYEISWFLNDIKLIDTTEVAEGEMPVHENPEIDGYIFVGWQPAIAPATGNRDYIAHFEERGENKVAVTFNTDGGTFINTQIINKDSTPERPADPEKTGYTFEGWYREAGFITPYNFNEPVNTDMTLYARWKVFTKSYTITWMDWNGNVLSSLKVSEGGLPDYPGASNPSRSGYIFTGWTPKIGLAYADQTYTATYSPQTVINGGGGGGGNAAPKKAAVTFSPNWFTDIYGVWRIKDKAGNIVTNAWLCDDAVTANGQNVWYLLTQDGAMLAAGLVQDNTGNFYSLETNHDGYFGMLRYTDGYYNCNGQQVYLKFSHEHNGTFGAVINADGIEKLKAIYGVTKYGIGNENSVYTKTF